MKLVHLVGFIIKKFVTMRGHMNVKHINYESSANMKGTIYGNRLPRGTQVKKVWNHCYRVYSLDDGGIGVRSWAQVGILLLAEIPKKKTGCASYKADDILQRRGQCR